MTIPHVKGRVARQAHVGLPEGTCEEEYARSGFSGAYAHLYRSEPPVGWTRIEGPLRPRAFDPTKDATPRAGDWLADRRALLANDDVVVSFGTLTAAMGYAFRNADADEILFVHQGGGTLESDFGPIAYRRGDYLVIPRGTAYRLVPVDNTALLVCETRGEVRFPERGMLGQHALFDPAVVEVPTPEAGASTLAANAAGEWELRVKRRSEITRVFYPFCPLNTVGWKGTLSVQRLNVADIRPVMSERYHLPPSAHTTFVADGVVLCTFLPRALENGDPEALKVPFFHSNIDFDEVLFYHDGDFFSRVGISPGMMTFHPQGIHHGPQPGAAERAAKADRTQEIAVMIDTRRPLDMLAAAEAVENTDYWKSWGSPRMIATRNDDKHAAITAENPLGLTGIEFVELSGPDPHAVGRLLRDMGFSRLMAHSARRVDYWRQNDIHMLVNTQPGSFAAAFQAAHGPCISAMGWRVVDAEHALAAALERGAVRAEVCDYDRDGEPLPAIVGIGGSLVYFVEDGAPSDAEARYGELGFVPLEDPTRVPELGFLTIDHLTNNVPKGEMGRWADFYKGVFGFTEVRYFDIRGVKTGLQSYALRSPCGTFCIPINEGTEEASQISEYLREYNGPGVQHLAFLTKDIIASLHGLHARGHVETLDIDAEYYAQVFDRVPNVREDKAEIERLKILVDGDEAGYLLQIFTKNVLGPIFIEIIQRENHFSFGEGNFGALFRSIERDQEARGVLA